MLLGFIFCICKVHCTTIYVWSVLPTSRPRYTLRREMCKCRKRVRAFALWCLLVSQAYLKKRRTPYSLRRVRSWIAEPPGAIAAQFETLKELLHREMQAQAPKATESNQLKKERELGNAKSNHAGGVAAPPAGSFFTPCQIWPLTELLLWLSLFRSWLDHSSAGALSPVGFYSQRPKAKGSSQGLRPETPAYGDEDKNITIPSVNQGWQTLKLRWLDGVGKSCALKIQRQTNQGRET